MKKYAVFATCVLMLAAGAVNGRLMSANTEVHLPPSDIQRTKKQLDHIMKPETLAAPENMERRLLQAGNGLFLADTAVVQEVQIGHVGNDQDNKCHCRNQSGLSDGCCPQGQQCAYHTGGYWRCV